MGSGYSVSCSLNNHTQTSTLPQSATGHFPPLTSCSFHFLSLSSAFAILHTLYLSILSINVFFGGGFAGKTILFLYQFKIPFCTLTQVTEFIFLTVEFENVRLSGGRDVSDW